MPSILNKTEFSLSSSVHFCNLTTPQGTHERKVSLDVTQLFMFVMQPLLVMSWIQLRLSSGIPFLLHFLNLKYIRRSRITIFNKNHTTCLMMNHYQMCVAAEFLQFCRLRQAKI